MKESFTPRPTLQPSLLPALVRKVVHQPITLAVAATTVLLITTFPHLTASKETATQKQIQVRRESYQAAIPLSLPNVDLNNAQERDTALQSMQLNVTEAKQMAADIQRVHDSKLIWVYVSDDMDEDGDVIELKSLHFTRTISIYHAPQRIAIYLAQGESQITVSGVKDGYGGITAAIRTNNGIIPLPYIWPGQSIAIPIL